MCACLRGRGGKVEKKVAVVSFVSAFEVLERSYGGFFFRLSMD